MDRRELDSRTRVTKLTDTIDRVLRRDVVVRAENRASRLAWLESLVRNGHPLPDTPEGEAEAERIYALIDRDTDGFHRNRADAGMGWDGIWRQRVRPVSSKRASQSTPESSISLRGEKRAGEGRS